MTIPQAPPEVIPEHKERTQPSSLLDVVHQQKIVTAIYNKFILLDGRKVKSSHGDKVQAMMSILHYNAT